MRTQTIDENRIITSAYELAEQEGLGALTIRSVATACGVSVGSIYSYYSSKDDLIAAVIEHFFAEAFCADFCIPVHGENYVAFCQRFFTTTCSTLENFRADWLVQIQSLDASARALGKSHEAIQLDHFIEGLCEVLADDPDVDLSRLPDGVTAHSICAYTLDNILAAAHDGRDCEVLFFLLEKALYGEGSSDVD